MLRLLVVILVWRSCLLFALWEPSRCLLEYRDDSPKVLSEPKFLDLKKKVIKQIEDGWCSESEASLIMDLVLLAQPKVCVEVGTFTGSFFLPISATLKYLNRGSAYAINAWSNEFAVKGVSPMDINYQWWKSVDMTSAKKKLSSMLKNWSLDPYCKIIHASPREAAHHIDSIDFLHLLGGLSEEQILLNTQLYLPKVSPGGYVLLSNVFLYVNETLTKMKALWVLLEKCEVVCEIENSNVVLFRKN